MTEGFKDLIVPTKQENESDCCKPCGPEMSPLACMPHIWLSTKEFPDMKNWQKGDHILLEVVQVSREDRDLEDGTNQIDGSFRVIAAKTEPVGKEPEKPPRPASVPPPTDDNE